MHALQLSPAPSGLSNRFGLQDVELIPHSRGCEFIGSRREKVGTKLDQERIREKLVD